MDINDIIIVLIIIFGLILFGLLVYIGLTTYLRKKDEQKLENKPLKESSMLDGLEKPQGGLGGLFKSKKKAEASKTSTKQNQSANIQTNNNTVANEAPKPQTREEREKQSNPFGVDMTRRLHKTSKENPNNKFIK